MCVCVCVYACACVQEFRNELEVVAGELLVPERYCFLRPYGRGYSVTQWLNLGSILAQSCWGAFSCVHARPCVTWVEMTAMERENVLVECSFH